MSKTQSTASDNCLVDALQKNAQNYRRDCHATAEKSMTMTFVLLTLLFVMALSRFLAG